MLFISLSHSFVSDDIFCGSQEGNGGVSNAAQEERETGIIMACLWFSVF